MRWILFILAGLAVCCGVLMSLIVINHSRDAGQKQPIAVRSKNFTQHENTRKYDDPFRPSGMTAVEFTVSDKNVEDKKLLDPRSFVDVFVEWDYTNEGGGETHSSTMFRHVQILEASTDKTKQNEISVTALLSTKQAEILEWLTQSNENTSVHVRKEKESFQPATRKQKGGAVYEPRLTLLSNKCRRGNDS
jgi:hypothetical protein